MDDGSHALLQVGHGVIKFSSCFQHRQTPTLQANAHLSEHWQAPTIQANADVSEKH
jgi:hypothetical protein